MRVLRFFNFFVADNDGPSFRQASLDGLGESESLLAFHIAGVLTSDFQTPESALEMLDGIDQVRRGDRVSFGCQGNSFTTTFFPDRVELEFDIDDEYPVYRLTTDEFRIALEGWHQFLQLPEHPDSIIEVQLPDRPLDWVDIRE